MSGSRELFQYNLRAVLRIEYRYKLLKSSRSRHFKMLISPIFSLSEAIWLLLTFRRRGQSKVLILMTIRFYNLMKTKILIMKTPKPSTLKSLKTITTQLPYPKTTKIITIIQFQEHLQCPITRYYRYNRTNLLLTQSLLNQSHSLCKRDTRPIQYRFRKVQFYYHPSEVTQQ